MTDKHTLVGPWEAENTCSQEHRWIVTAPHPYSDTARLRIASGIEDEGQARLIASAPEAASRITALEAREAELVDALTQYRDDLRYPPTPDSKIRRLEMIAKLLERMTP